MPVSQRPYEYVKQLWRSCFVYQNNFRQAIRRAANDRDMEMSKDQWCMEDAKGTRTKHSSQNSRKLTKNESTKYNFYKNNSPI